MATSILVGWVAATVGLWLAANVLRGVRVTSFVDAVWAGALTGVLQWALSDLLFVLIGIGTLGIAFLLWFITRWVVAALIIMLAAKLSSRLHVNGFFSALVTAFIIAAVGTVLRWLV
ncbi:MAG TPA: phage holin family protein [Polyangiales bacterium]|nr:phage holin family protein [Polyangiales bacterium]